MIDSQSDKIFYTTDISFNQAISGVNCLSNFTYYPITGDNTIIGIKFPKHMHMEFNSTGAINYKICGNYNDINSSSYHFVSDISSKIKFNVKYGDEIFISHSGTNISTVTDLKISYYPIEPHIDTSYENVHQYSGINFIDGQTIGDYQLSDIMDVEISASDDQSTFNDDGSSNLVTLNYDVNITSTTDKTNKIYTGLKLTITPKVDFKMWFPNFTTTLTKGVTVKKGTQADDNTFSTSNPVSNNAYWFSVSNSSASKNSESFMPAGGGQYFHYAYRNAFIIGYHDKNPICNSANNSYDMEKDKQYIFYFRGIYNAFIVIYPPDKGSSTIGGLYKKGQEYISYNNGAGYVATVGKTTSTKLYYPSLYNTPFHAAYGKYSYSKSDWSSDSYFSDFRNVTRTAFDLVRTLNQFKSYINMSISIDTSKISK